MYDDWQIKRWTTPVSDVESLVMVSLIDDGTLRITFEAPRLSNRPRWCFTFESYPAYRNILEEYRLGLWNHLDQSDQRCGNTFTVENSPWIAYFKSEEPLLETRAENFIHYVISTEDDVIEIIASSVEIIDLGDTASDMPRAGKSIVFYNPDDREQIKKVFEEIVEENKFRRE
jgi:hypothetical protein